MKLIFMGTPAFAVPALQKLLASRHTVVAVYTQPPRPAGRGQKETLSPIHSQALAHTIPVHTPKSLRDPVVQAELKALNADVVIVAAYGLLLPPSVLEACPYGCINIHPSLLPRWRGAAPIQRPLLAGDAETGVTIMQMDAGLDTGDMLLVKKIPINATDSYETLHDTLMELGGDLLLETLDGLEKGTLQPVKQQEEGVTYASKLTKEEGRIAWHLPACSIERMIRAFTPWPGAYFSYKGEIIKILKASWESTAHTTAPGTIMDEAFSIACGEGLLHPLILQRSGRSKMACADFLRGFSIEIGERVE